MNKSLNTTRTVLILLIGVFIIARLALPEYAKHVINQQLGNLKEYRGHVEDVSLAIWRGAYSVQGVMIEKRDGHAQAPLFISNEIDFSLDWSSLLHGEVLADIRFVGPEINFVDQKKDGDQTGKDQDWREVVKSLVPITINTFQIQSGAIHFRNFASSPPVNLQLSELDIVVSNLTNADRGKKAQQARIDGSGKMLDHAPFEVYGILDPLGNLENFDINLRISDIDLRRANTLTKAYANFDFQSGHGDFVMELRARDGNLNGYAKPLLNDVDIIDWEEAKELSAPWEGFVAAVSWLLSNHDKERIASKIEIKGELQQQDVSTWQAFTSILRNAFIQAYEARFDNS